MDGNFFYELIPSNETLHVNQVKEYESQRRSIETSRLESEDFLLYDEETNTDLNSAFPGSCNLDIPLRHSNSGLDINSEKLDFIEDKQKFFPNLQFINNDEKGAKHLQEFHETRNTFKTKEKELYYSDEPRQRIKATQLETKDFSLYDEETSIDSNSSSFGSHDFEFPNSGLDLSSNFAKDNPSFFPNFSFINNEEKVKLTEDNRNFFPNPIDNEEKAQLFISPKPEEFHSEARILNNSQPLTSSNCDTQHNCFADACAIITKLLHFNNYISGENCDKILKLISSDSEDVYRIIAEILYHNCLISQKYPLEDPQMIVFRFWFDHLRQPETI